MATTHAPVSRAQAFPGLSTYAHNAPSGNGALASLARFISESLILTGLARASAAALVLVSTVFFLLSSFTFSWLNIVRNENVLWIPTLVRSYPFLYWVVFALNALTLLPAFYRGKSRWFTEAVLLVMASIGMLLTRVYRLDDLPLAFANIAWSVALTIPLLGLGVHDFALFSSPRLWSRLAHERSLPLGFAFAGGGLVGACYFLIALLRHNELSLHLMPLLAVLAITLLLHGCMFAGIAMLLSAGAGAMLRSQAGVRSRLTLSLALIWIFAGVLLRKLVTPALSFNNFYADLWSWCYPLAFLIMLAGWHVRRSALRDEAVPSRAEEILCGLIPSGRVSAAVAAGAALLIAVSVPLLIERVDWNFLFQRLSAIAVWLLMLIVMWRLFSRPAATRKPSLKGVALLIATVACCFGLAQSNRLAHSFGLKAVAQSIVAYSGTDASFQVAQIAFRPVVRDNDRTGLFPFLRRNALIADPIGPARLKLAESLTSASGAKPSIYIMVIDSMRRDYLSPYNPGVTFTPNIASFARESFVFQRAYTNYGGTALSEPAIWAGAMIPSKHYVQPFSEINALEKLTATDGYKVLVTRDQILMKLLSPLPLDAWLNVDHRQYFGLDFRDTVREINHREAQPDRRPRFVYSQPQNLHPITLHEVEHSGTKVQGAYPGFNARYADELRKVDEAFGKLIEGLKAGGEFDHSIVILTSDHGELLGEYGHWGHGQSLLPPIIEVPLLIHLPSGLGARMYCNPSQPVFLTDITPSLYYLLGHRALRKGEFFGRPLFTERAEEQGGYARPYEFFMSSYAAVFGLLEENTQTLYVADAVDENQSLYDLHSDRFGLDNLLDKNSQAKFDRLTREYIDRLNALYGYSSAQR